MTRSRRISGSPPTPVAGLLFVFALTGCPTGTPPGEGDDLPGPYLYNEEDEVGGQVLSAEQLASAVEEAIEQAMGIRIDPWREAYLNFQSEADPACPVLYTTGSSEELLTYWTGDCVSTDGARFEGESYHYDFLNIPQDGGGFLNGWYHVFAGELTDPTGQALAGAGSVSQTTTETAGYSTYLQVIEGTFAWEGASSSDTWLEDELSPTLTTTLIHAPPDAGGGFGGGRYTQITGGVGGLTGELTTVSISDLVIFDASIGSQCPEEPGGTVSVRDESGDWYDIVFDGHEAFDDEDIDLMACDGCGETWYRGQPMGSTCIDASPLLAWDAPPW